MRTTIVGQKIIAYYRVSTKKQGTRKKNQRIVLGLGLEAQKEAVAQYVRQHKMDAVAHYTEVETGKIAERPELQKAIAHARLAKAVLVVAKLDRLARNVQFTATLMNSGVEFVACDNPQANRLTIHILASVAENEARAISERTTAALAVLKQEGTKLGSARHGHWTGRQNLRFHKDNADLVQKANARSLQKRREQSRTAYAFLIETIREMREKQKSLVQVADWLNGEGHRTTRGSIFRPGTVLRILKQFSRHKGSAIAVKF